MIDVLQLIILALFTSLVSIGVYSVCRAKNDLLFCFIGQWYEDLIIKRKLKFQRTRLNLALDNYEKRKNNYAERYFWLVNPLFECPYCMSSFWSALIYVIFIPITWTCLIELPLQILAVLTLNSILIKILYPNGI